MIRGIVLLAAAILITEKIQAQVKKKYFVFAFTSKRIDWFCTEAILLKNQEVELVSSESVKYGEALQQQYNNQYLWKDGYNASVVIMVPEEKSILYYKLIEKAELKNCTKTKYDFVIADNIRNAELKFAENKEKYKTITFEEEGRWGKQPTTSSTKTEFTDNIDGVSVAIKKSTGNNGKTNSIVKIKNNKIGKKVMLYIMADDKVIYEPSLLNSGGTITLSAGDAKNITYHVVWVSEDVETPSVYETIKQKIQKEVTNPDVIRKKVSIPCMCIRG